MTKMAKKCPFGGGGGAVWVPRMSMEGSICIVANLDDEETPLITSVRVCFASGPNDLFGGLKYRKTSLQTSLFAYLFTFHQLVLCLIAMHGLSWARLWRQIIMKGITCNFKFNALIHALLAPPARMVHAIG